MWSGVEWSGGRMSDQPRQTKGWINGRGGQSSRKNLNLEGHSLVLLLPLFWVEIPPPNIEHALWSRRPVKKKMKKKK